jgi:two-component system, NarL family, sensor histidine kinase DesK
MQVEHISTARAQLQSAEDSRRTAGLQDMVVASGISLRLWRLYAQAWLVCMLFPILSLAQLDLPLVRLLPAGAGMAIFVACYTWAMWSHPVRAHARERRPSRTTYVLLTSLVALAIALSLAYGSAFLWLLVGVSAVAGVLLPARSAFLAVMVLTLLTLGSSVAIAGSLGVANWLHIIPLVLLVRGLGLDMVGLARLASALREVHAARGELARMAVTDERLRMARDLHDLLGHTLAMITLKSELAQRLVEQDPARAALEMREVEQAARQTLREVREAVAGYRQPRLASELDGARQLLEAAGIDCQIENTTGALPAGMDAVLGWAVREGITNVIRHGRAQQCTIRIICEAGSVRAEVINDGEQKPISQGDIGSGLAGLAERVRACRGTLEAGPFQAVDTGGFRLRVELPLPGQISSGKEQRG